MRKTELFRETMGAIIKTARLNKRVMDFKIQQLGIHHSQHFLLMLLSKQPQMPSQSDIAKELDISPAAVATTIKKLKQSGYIEKKIATEDERFHEIGLTEKGRQVIEQSKELFRQKDKEIFDGISEEEITVTCNTVKKLLQNLKELEEKQRKGELK